MPVTETLACELGGLANTISRGMVPCDPGSQDVCWAHKMRHKRDTGTGGLTGGFAFTQACKGSYTQREIMGDTVAGLAPGDELQRS